MKKLLLWPALGLAFLSASVYARQAVETDEFVVHYNALNTSQLTPQVAQAYGIQRSPSRVLVNITVMKRGEYGGETPVSAAVQATATNLTGQRRAIEFREINDPEGAIYHIGELRVRNMETFDFAVTVAPAGSSENLQVNFRKQFYTE